MKRTISKKKLSLDTTTISRLTGEQLQEVAGGLPRRPTPTKVSLCDWPNCPSAYC